MSYLENNNSPTDSNEYYRLKRYLFIDCGVNANLYAKSALQIKPRTFLKTEFNCLSDPNFYFKRSKLFDIFELTVRFFMIISFFRTILKWPRTREANDFQHANIFTQSWWKHIAPGYQNFLFFPVWTLICKLNSRACPDFQISCYLEKFPK